MLKNSWKEETQVSQNNAFRCVKNDTLSNSPCVGVGLVHEMRDHKEDFNRQPTDGKQRYHGNDVRLMRTVPIQ